MKTTDKAKVRDLRDNVNARAADPGIAKELDELKPLVDVDQPRLVTPGIGVQTPGQTTHE
jgi:hypothetical protein